MYNVFHFIIIFSLFITTINDLVSEFQSMMVSGQDTQKNVHVHLTNNIPGISTLKLNYLTKLGYIVIGIPFNLY